MSGKQSQLTTLFKRSNGICHYCLTKTERKKGSRGYQKPNTATKEHVIPRSLGGPDAAHNYVLACHDCNNRRGIILFFCRCSGCTEKVYEYLSDQSNVDKMFWTIVNKNKARIAKRNNGDGWVVIRLGYKTRWFDTWQQAIDFVNIVNAPVREI